MHGSVDVGSKNDFRPERRPFSLVDYDNDSSKVLVNRKYFKEQELARYCEA
jgi:hypothetical protein